MAANVLDRPLRGPRPTIFIKVDSDGPAALTICGSPSVVDVVEAPHNVSITYDPPIERDGAAEGHPELGERLIALEGKLRRIKGRSRKVALMASTLELDRRRVEKKIAKLYREHACAAVELQNAELRRLDAELDAYSAARQRARAELRGVDMGELDAELDAIT